MLAPLDVLHLPLRATTLSPHQELPRIRSIVDLWCSAFDLMLPRLHKPEPGRQYRVRVEHADIASTRGTSVRSPTRVTTHMVTCGSNSSAGERLPGGP